MELELRLNRQHLARLYLSSNPLVTGTVCLNGTVQHFDAMPQSDALNFAGPQEFVPDAPGSPGSIHTARLLLSADDAGVAFRALIILARFGSEGQYHSAIAEFHRRGGNTTAGLVDSMFARVARNTQES